MTKTAFDATDSRRRPLSVVEWALVLLLIAGAAARFYFGDEFIYTVFTDRDLLRALSLTDEFEYMGAEAVGHVARTPGGALAYFLWLLQQIDDSVPFLYRVTLGIDVLSLALVAILFTPIIGRIGALFAAASYGAALVVLENLWKFWNPSFTPILAVLIAWLMMAYVTSHRRWQIVAAFATIGIASQAHISFFALIPIVLLYVVLALRRLPVADIFLGLVAITLTFLPYVVLDGSRGFENTVALFVRPEAAGALPGVGASYGDDNWFYRASTSLAWLTGGRTFRLDGIPATLKDNPILLILALAVLNASLFAFAAWALMSTVGRLRIRQSFGFGFSPSEAALLPLSVLSIAIGYRYGDNASARYFLFLFMPVLVLAGVVFREALSVAERLGGRRLALSLGVVGALGLAAKHAIIAHHYGSSGRNAIGSFRIAEAVVDTLKRNFGFADSDIEFRVALLYETPAGDLIFPAQPENLALTYLARTQAGESQAPRYPGCALVMTPTVRGARLMPLDAGLLGRALPPGDEIHIDRIVENDGLRVIGYGSERLNCPRSFGNAYALTDEEKAMDRIASGLGPKQVATVTLGNGHRGFIVNTADRGSAPVLVEIRDRQEPIGVMLHANGARGYAPSARYERVSFDGLAVRFTPVSGVEGQVIVYGADTIIGENGLYTPWRLSALLPPDPGMYAVDLEIRRINGFSGATGPVRIRLHDKFEIVPLAAPAARVSNR